MHYLRYTNYTINEDSSLCGFYTRAAFFPFCAASNRARLLIKSGLYSKKYVSMWWEKVLYCNKRDGENVGHFIRNLVILNGEF